jgi:hypothetical protein
LEDRPFSGNPARLLALADDRRERIRRAAVAALSNVSHPDVRSRAEALLQSNDRFTDGASMLAGNYEPGDFGVLQDLLSRPITEREYHDLGFSVGNILERHPTTDAEGSLLLLYENNPCSNCRRACVRFLIDMKKIPEWMRIECRYDANADMIEAVQQLESISQTAVKPPPHV